MKICCQCNLSKELTCFSKHKKYGLQSACKSCMSEYQKQYRALNSEKTYTDAKVYREVNKNKIAKQKRIYQIENKKQLAEYSNAYEKLRKKEDIEFRLRKQLRSRLATAINQNTKVGSAVNDLGCTIEELKKHLESKFTLGMSWENWSRTGWHIDHIIPLASFDLTNPEQLKEACHYTNLRPLWAEENLKKSDHE